MLRVVKAGAVLKAKKTSKIEEEAPSVHDVIRETKAGLNSKGQRAAACRNLFVHEKYVNNDVQGTGLQFCLSSSKIVHLRSRFHPETFS